MLRRPAGTSARRSPRGHRTRSGVLRSLAVALVPAALAVSSVAPAPSPGSLTAALKSALAAKVLPSPLMPTLQQLASDVFKQEGAFSDLRSSCNPYSHPSQASDPKPCWYGSTTSTDPVIVIFGDSFVGNWVPALDLAGSQLGYRVADFEFLGCNTPFVTPTVGPGFDATQVAACKQWHQHLPAAVQSLHPKAIVAASGAPSWGAVGDRQWMEGLKLAFSELNPSGTSTEILMGTGIHLRQSAPQCLAAYARDLQRCDFHYTPTSKTAAALARDATAVSEIPHLQLIPTSPWVCVNGACPLVVSHIVVYADVDHLTVDYSVYLSKVFITALKAALQAG